MRFRYLNQLFAQSLRRHTQVFQSDVLRFESLSPTFSRHSPSTTQAHRTVALHDERLHRTMDIDRDMWEPQASMMNELEQLEGDEVQKLLASAASDAAEVESQE